VRYGDRETEYNSLDEMLRLRELMRAEISISTSATGSAVFAGRIT
jgi:hypothetical protein